MGLRVLLVLPAWNEATNLPLLLTELRQLYPSYSVLVVDDGSLDATADVSREYGAAVVSLPVNLGIGAAVQTGFLFAQRYDYDIVVRLDSDGQHPPEEVARLVAALADGVDVVVGSRFLKERSYRSSWLRRVGISWLSLLIRVLTGKWIADCTSGFCVYRRDAVDYLAAHYPQDYPEPESLALLIRNGFRVNEVPIRMQARRNGTSSIRGGRTLYYMIKVSLAVLIEAFRSPTRL